MSRYSRLLSNTLVFTAGRMLSKLLVFFMIGFYTACLSPEEYSTAELIANMANLLISLACLGISEGIFRSAAAKTGDKEAYFTNGLVVYGVGSLAFLLLAPLMRLAPFLVNSVWLIVCYVVVANLHSVVSQYLCAIGRTKLYALQGILNTALVIGFNILFLPVLDFGVTGYILSTVLADLTTTVFLILLTRLWRAFKVHTIAAKTIVDMLKFCLPLVPTTIFWWITGVSDRYMVAWMCSGELNGLYTVAYKIPNLLIYAISIFDSAWKLSVSAEDDPETCKAFYSRVWRVYTTVAFIGGGALILACRLFAKILFAEAYGDAWRYIPILTLATVFTALCTFLGSVYFSSRRTVWSMITAFMGAILNVTLNFLLIPGWGAMGASIATFASYFAVCILRIITTRRLIPFKQELGRGLMNTLLLSGMTIAVTLTGSFVSASMLLWGIAMGLFVMILAVNLRPILELLKDIRGMIRRK